MPREEPRNQPVGHWTESHFLQLKCGWDFSGDAWGDAPKDNPNHQARDDMRACWEEHHERITDEWIQRDPCRRPWAWWQFTSTVPLSMDIPEPFQLDHLGELSEVEKRAHYEMYTKGIEVNPEELTCLFAPFRRPVSWWWFTSPVPRDLAKPEAFQLVELRDRIRLSGMEQKAIDAPSRDIAELIHHGTRLCERERHFLKLPDVNTPAPQSA